MTLTQQKLDELEIIESIYPEKIEVDNHDLVNCQDCANDPGKHPMLRFNIKFDQLHLEVLLPSDYPEGASAEIRISWSALDSSQEFQINDSIKLILSENKGDSVILLVMSELTNLLLDIVNDQLQSSNLEETPADFPEVSIYSRVWYYAHHIYSREKRTNMLQWSKEWCLTGFILPGKPGIICIEGLKKNCKEFNSRVRAMNWQLLKLQHEEPTLSSEEMKFENLKELIFDVHGRDNKHQDLGQFRTFLSEIGLDNVFQVLFNV